MILNFVDLKRSRENFQDIESTLELVLTQAKKARIENVLHFNFSKHNCFYKGNYLIVLHQICCEFVFRMLLWVKVMNVRLLLVAVMKIRIVISIVHLIATVAVSLLAECPVRTTSNAMLMNAIRRRSVLF